MKGAVLVADDEPTIRELLHAVLTDEGFEVVLATNGQQALTAIESTRPDVVLMDVMMPVLDGREAVRQIANLPEDVRPRIVMMSAAMSISQDEPHVSLFLSKPFDLDRLLEAVESLLDRRS